MLSREAIFLFVCLLYKYLGHRGLPCTLILFVVCTSNISGWMSGHREPSSNLMTVDGPVLLSSNSGLQGGLSVSELPAGAFPLGPRPSPNNLATTGDLRISASVQGFSTVALLPLGLHNSSLCGADPCIVGWSALSLASTQQRPLPQSSQPPLCQGITACPLRAQSFPVENHFLRGPLFMMEVHCDCQVVVGNEMDSECSLLVYHFIPWGAPHHVLFS